MLNTITAPTTPLLNTPPMFAHPARVTAIKDEAYAIATYEIEFEADDLKERYAFRAGQFNMVYLPNIGEVPISLSSDPAETDVMGHTIRYAGNVTRAISRLRIGDTVGIRGPYGTAWPLERIHGNDVCIVTGGIGLAPLRPVIYHIINNRSDYGRVYLLYGARTPIDMLYTEQFEDWEAHGIEIHQTVDRADESWKGHVGVVPMMFYHLRLNPKKTTVLTCGPEIMIHFVIFEALARRIPKEQIYVSMERNMKCGVGLCGHCQFGPTFVCKEGPVFAYATIEPFFGVEDF